MGEKYNKQNILFFRKAVSVSAPEVQLFSTPEVGLTGSISTGSISTGSTPHWKLVQSADWMEFVVEVEEVKDEFRFKSALFWLLSRSSSKFWSSAFEANFSTFVHLKSWKRNIKKSQIINYNWYQYRCVFKQTKSEVLHNKVINVGSDTFCNSIFHEGLQN